MTDEANMTVINHYRVNRKFKLNEISSKHASISSCQCPKSGQRLFLTGKHFHFPKSLLYERFITSGLTTIRETEHRVEGWVLVELGRDAGLRELVKSCPHFSGNLPEFQGEKGNFWPEKWKNKCTTKVINESWEHNKVFQRFLTPFQ